MFFIDDFDASNPMLDFLNGLDSLEAIESWVNRLTSRIVLKFDEEAKSIDDFIYDFIKLG